MSITIYSSLDLNTPSLNLANGNFCHVFGQLGLLEGKDYCCGEVSPGSLIDALTHTNPRDLIRPTERDGICIHCGVDIEWVLRVFLDLSFIAYYAKANGTPIHWG